MDSGREHFNLTTNMFSQRNDNYGRARTLEISNLQQAQTSANDFRTGTTGMHGINLIPMSPDSFTMAEAS